MCETRECTSMHGGHGPLVPGYYRTGWSGVFPSLLISRILAFPCTVCVDRTWKRRRIVSKSCYPSCKLNTHCRIRGHFGTMKMTGTKTGRRINERSLTLIRPKIFGGRIKFIFFVVLYHSCLRYRIIIIIIVIIAICLLNGCFIWCSFSLLAFVTNIFYRNMPVNVH